jgi:hypothetical protein
LDSENRSVEVALTLRRPRRSVEFVLTTPHTGIVLGSHGPAPVFAMSLGDISRERIRDRRLIRSDGSIHLIARAWAVRGRVPS